MITLVLLVLSLLGCGNGPGCVDETGYETCEGTEGNVTDDGVGAHPEDDEAVGLWYTAAAPLGDVLAPVTVLGAPGLLPDATTVSLSVEDGASVSAPVMAGGFVAEVEAALDDTVTLTPDVGDPLTLVLAADLADLPRADADAAAGGGTGGTDAPTPPPVQDGGVAVGDGALGFVAPPYLAWVVGRPSVVQVDVGTDATLPADAGEALCVARLSGAQAGLQGCVTL